MRIKWIVTFMIFVAVLFLVACEEEKDEKEEKYIVEDLQFKPEKSSVLKAIIFILTGETYDKVIVTTDVETLAFYLSDLIFIKTEDEESRAILKKTTIGEIENEKVEIFLTDNDVKKVSKQYVNLYSK